MGARDRAGFMPAHVSLLLYDANVARQARPTPVYSVPRLRPPCTGRTAAATDDHRACRALDLAREHLAARAEGPLSPEGCRLPGLPGRRRCARPAARDRAQ